MPPYITIAAIIFGCLMAGLTIFGTIPVVKRGFHSESRFADLCNLTACSQIGTDGCNWNCGDWCFLCIKYNVSVSVGVTEVVYNLTTTVSYPATRQLCLNSLISCYYDPQNVAETLALAAPVSYFDSDAITIMALLLTVGTLNFLIVIGTLTFLLHRKDKEVSYQTF